jgi:membrane-bound lytic murein transglycosylase A
MDDGSKVPYYSRKEIDIDGVLAAKNLEIAWVDDPVERYWMQVQGSGILRFTDSSEGTLKFAGHNGYPYRSIAQDLLNQKKVKGDFLQIKIWLKNRPHEALSYFTGNKRYIFFTLSSGPPTGVERIPLTPGRTLAADLSHYPVGTAIFLQSQIPVVDGSGEVKGFQRVNRVMIISDTGDAIRGPNHVDYYVGEGTSAELVASRLKTQGTMHVMLVREP